MEVYRALLAAARQSSGAVLDVLDRESRALERALDVTLYFASDGERLSCAHARGARAEHFAKMTLSRESGSLPARAALGAHPMLLTRESEIVIPLDRSALAVPAIAERCVRGVWYAASATAHGLASVQHLIALASCATEAYFLACEREDARADATVDSLTGVLSPRAFRSRIHELVCAARESVLSLWFVDTDRFKRINDEYGHAAGDLVLQRMAFALCAHAVPEVDAVGRKGGDEFCMLLRGSPKMHALERARRFCADVRTRDFGVPPRVTASVGVAAYPFDAGDAASLLEAADAAMYHAKRCGRDRVAYAVEGAGFALYE